MNDLSVPGAQLRAGLRAGLRQCRTELNNPECLSPRPPAPVLFPNLTTVPNQMIRSTQHISGHKEPVSVGSGKPSEVI